MLTDCAHVCTQSHEQAVASVTLINLRRGPGSAPLESERETQMADAAPGLPDEGAGHCKAALWA